MELPPDIFDQDDEQARAMEAMQARDRQSKAEYDEWNERLELAKEVLIDRCREHCCRRRAPVLMIDGRVKEWDSLLPKLQEGHADPWDTCSDLLGLRIVVLSIDEVHAAHTAVSSLLRPDSKPQEQQWHAIGPRSRGYQALHLALELPSDIEVPKNATRAELQIVTAMQDAWGTFSHDDFYKAPLGVPLELSIRVLRLAAVMNLVDKELQDIRTALEPQVQKGLGQVNEFARRRETRVMLDEVTLVGSAAGPLRNEFVALKQLARTAGFRVSGWAELVRPGAETADFLHFAAEAGIHTVTELQEACDRASQQEDLLQRIVAKIRDIVESEEGKGAHIPLFDRPLHVLQATEMQRMGHAIKSPFRPNVTKAIHAVIGKDY